MLPDLNEATGAIARPLLPGIMAPFGCAWLGSEDQMSRSTQDSVRVVAPGQTYIGKQGITYGAGASAETVGAKRVCMNVMPMPPGGALPPGHRNHRLHAGRRMQRVLRRQAGIPADRARRRPGLLSRER